MLRPTQEIPNGDRLTDDRRRPHTVVADENVLSVDPLASSCSKTTTTTERTSRSATGEQCNLTNFERCTTVRERAAMCLCLPGFARSSRGRRCLRELLCLPLSASICLFCLALHAPAADVDVCVSSYICLCLPGFARSSHGRRCLPEFLSMPLS